MRDRSPTAPADPAESLGQPPTHNPPQIPPLPTPPPEPCSRPFTAPAHHFPTSPVLQVAHCKAHRAFPTLAFTMGPRRTGYDVDLASMSIKLDMRRSGSLAGVVPASPVGKDGQPLAPRGHRPLTLRRGLAVGGGRVEVRWDVGWLGHGLPSRRVPPRVTTRGPVSHGVRVVPLAEA
jgi:hypothetical protein